MTINRFIPLYNTQSGAIPTASAMFDGELAVNIADGKLYTRFGDNIVALNDTTNFVSSSQQVTALIYNANIAPNSVTANELIVSGSAIIQSNLTVQGAISASSITGSFKGDGSQLTGIPTTLRISGSTGSDAVDLLTDDLTFGGLNGIVASVTDNTVTIDVPVGLTASLYGTASVADGIDVIFAGEFITGSDSYIIPNPSGGLSYITTASYALTASYVIGGGGGGGTSGTSGTSGATGINGTSGTSGLTGQSGTSGTSGQTGASGTSGTSGESGIAGTSGTSGTSPELSSGVVSSSIQILNYNTFLTTASTSFTGSLFGTSSWAYSSLTASYALNGGGSGTSGTAGTSGTSGVVPDGVLSSSQQILDYNIFATTGSNNFVGNQTVTGSFTISGSSTFTNIGPAIFSGSVTSTDLIIGSLYGTSSWSQNSSNVDYTNVVNKPTLVSASSQISYTGVSNIPSGIVSTSAQVVASLPTGTVSSSTQVSNYNIFATTGSNIFKASQTITGSLYITEELVVLGSSSIQYVSQSTLNIGTNLITVNAQNPSVRFGGLAVIDSASSPRVSGSLLFDSVENQWIYVHQGTTTTSSLLIMGPETYNNLGNETHPTTNHIMKSVNDEHIGNSQITDDGTTVSIPGNLSVTGVISGSQFSGRFTGSFLGTSSLATTASYASPTGLPSGLISSSTQIVSFGTIRLTVGTSNKNSGASFYFNSNTTTAGDSTSPGQDTAFLISSTGLSNVTVYLRQSAAGPNATIVGVAKNANGTAFSSATLITSSSASLTANTIQTYTFSGLTLNQFDAIHIYVDPTNAPSEVFGVVIVS